MTDFKKITLSINFGKKFFTQKSMKNNVKNKLFILFINYFYLLIVFV